MRINKENAEEAGLLFLHGRMAKFWDSIRWNGIEGHFLGHAEDQSSLVSFPRPNEKAENYQEVLGKMQKYGYINGPCLNLIVKNSEVLEC